LRFAILLLLAPAAFAQQQPRNEVWAFVSAGPGVAYSHMIAREFSAQLAVAWERHDSYAYIVNPDGSVQPIAAVRLRTHPLDFVFRYHFLNDTRWKPYVGAGVHYVASPGAATEFGYHNHINPAITGGTVFLINRSFGVVVDGRVYIGDHENYDEVSKAALGLAWRF